MRWKSTFVSLLIVATVFAWMSSGDIGNEAVRAAAAEKEADKNKSTAKNSEVPFLVTVRPSQARDFSRQIRINGRTRAPRSSSVKAELQSRVLEVLVAEGDLVAEGAPLARLSKDTRPAAYASAIAGLERARKNYTAMKDLSAGGYQSELELLSAKEALIKAQQAVTQSKKNLDDTTIKAPYGGIIQKVSVEKGEMTALGTTVVELIDLDPIEVVVFVSERELANITLGSQAEITLLNGEKHVGLVHYIAASSDVRTGTFEVRIRLANPDMRLRAGISSNVTIFGETVLAHFASKSLLTLNAEGLIGVKAVSDNDHVIFYPIEIIEDAEDGIYLGGLPAEVRFIVVGQDFVKTGNMVRTETEAQ